MPLNDDLDAFLEQVLFTFRAKLTATVKGHLIRAYIQGDAEMVTWGKTLGGIPIAYEGPPLEQAIKYAQNHGAQLVTRMDDETKNRLAKIVSDAIRDKRGVPGLARDIRADFTDMTKYRSKMIARTETCDALEKAFIDRSKAMGVTGKEWTVSDPCDICQQNADAGVIPIDDAFPSGDDRPPAHPSCKCALAPVMIKDVAENYRPREFHNAMC